MTTDVIDLALHASAFPATYIGDGTLIGNVISSAGDENDFHGYFTSDGNAVSIPCGFRPLEIRVINETDGIEWEWQYGMAATHTIKTVFATPAITVDTGSAILVTDDGTGTHSKFTVTFSAGLAGASKNIIFKIEG